MVGYPVQPQFGGGVAHLPLREVAVDRDDCVIGVGRIVKDHLAERSKGFGHTTGDLVKMVKQLILRILSGCVFPQRPALIIQP